MSLTEKYLFLGGVCEIFSVFMYFWSLNYEALITKRIQGFEVLCYSSENICSHLSMVKKGKWDVIIRKDIQRKPSDTIILLYKSHLCLRLRHGTNLCILGEYQWCNRGMERGDLGAKIWANTLLRRISITINKN